MNNKTKKFYLAAYLVKKKKFVIKKVAIPEIKKDEILIKVKSCSICGSDLKIFNKGTKRFKLPQITGHEISGQIISVGKKINKFKVGDNVAIGADIDNYINLAIGHEMPGGFAEYMVLNKLMTQKGPIKTFKNISYDTAALAEPLGCCINGFEKSNVKKNSNILIIGGGPIGLILSSLSLMFKPKNLILIENSKKRLKIIKKAAKHISNILDGNDKNIKSNINNITNNNGADYIFVANSNPISQIESFDFIANNGVINFFGGLLNNKKISIPTNDIHYKQLKIVGSHGSSVKHHAKAVKLLEKRKINLDFCLTHNFSLKNIKKAFQLAKTGKSLKITINPE